MRLYLDIPENFMRLIFKGRFWFVQLSFFSTVKFLSLVQFPVGYFSRPFMPVLLFPLSQFAGFAFYMINCFISVTTYSEVTILLYIIDL